MSAEPPRGGDSAVWAASGGTPSRAAEGEGALLGLTAPCEPASGPGRARCVPGLSLLSSRGEPRLSCALPCRHGRPDRPDDPAQPGSRARAVCYPRAAREGETCSFLHAQVSVPCPPGVRLALVLPPAWAAKRASSLWRKRPRVRLRTPALQCFLWKHSRQDSNSGSGQHCVISPSSSMLSDGNA